LVKFLKYRERHISVKLGGAQTKPKRRHAVHLEVNVSEVFEVFKEIGAAPEKLFDMRRLDLREIAGSYLSALMEWELTIHLGRKRYEIGWGRRSIIAMAPIRAISPPKGISGRSARWKRCGGSRICPVNHRNPGEAEKGLPHL
jgi:hypothetical protein